MHKKVAALGKCHGDSQFWKCFGFKTFSFKSFLSFRNILRNCSAGLRLVTRTWHQPGEMPSLCCRLSVSPWGIQCLIFPIYSHLTGVERKYVKYCQIFRYQVADAFVYTHSWFNTYSYQCLSLPDKRDQAISEVGWCLKIIAVCVLYNIFSFTRRSSPVHCAHGVQNLSNWQHVNYRSEKK